MCVKGSGIRWVEGAHLAPSQLWEFEVKVTLELGGAAQSGDGPRSDHIFL